MEIPSYAKATFVISDWIQYFLADKVDIAYFFSVSYISDTGKMLYVNFFENVK